MISVFVLEVEFVIEVVPRYLYVSTLSIGWLLTYRVGKVEGALRMSINSYFVLVMLRSRQFRLHQSKKVASLDSN